MRILLALLLAVQGENITHLTHSNPRVREHACRILGLQDFKPAIPRLIKLLEKEPDTSVQAAAVEALEQLTGKKGFGPDYAKWQQWWDNEGMKNFPMTSLSREEVSQIVQPWIDDLRNDARFVKRDVQVISIINAIIAVAFVLVMIYFVGHVSSKLKEWRDLAKQVGLYIEESQKVTKRTDRVLEELEAKKVDILEFFKKVREEKEAEIERHAELLQENTEHRMREEAMGLRQKAEKELEETLGQLRQQVDLEVRRLGTDQKEKIEKDFKAQHERFMKEVEAHTLFLQAGFFHTHGKPEEALKTYKRLLAQKPDHAVAWEKMGAVYRELMRYEEALEAFQKAVELDPNNPACWYNMAATYARLRKRDRMLEALALAVKNDGEFKDEALNDPSFRDYWHDPAFKDLAEA